ncbi:MAG: hypothetical protein NZ958_03280 [Bacteroidia bacterium]|nr:hypothetical protein [Bacteroidia bacterium]MDW8088242.1 hypothetical protein [Bacteroidia bacterium]
MKPWAFLGLASLLWAQYQLTFFTQDPAKRQVVELQLRLAPTHVRLIAKGTWDTLQGELDFLLLPDKKYWLDHGKKVAYDVTAFYPDTIFFQKVELAGYEVVEGQEAVRAIFRLPGQRLEVLWAEKLAFDWTPWLRHFRAEGLILAAHYFRRGLPLGLRLWSAEGTLLQEVRLHQWAPYPYTAADAQPPYPVKRLTTSN